MMEGHGFGKPRRQGGAGGGQQELINSVRAGFVSSVFVVGCGGSTRHSRRRYGGNQVLPDVQSPGAVGSEEPLLAGYGIEVAVQLPQVKGDVASSLGLRL